MVKTALTLFFMLVFVSLASADETWDTITFTTYYPSPYGVYNEMNVASRMAVGDVNNDGQYDNSDMATYYNLYHVAALQGQPIPGGLTVRGDVGIGTAIPRANLHVHNPNWQGSMLISGASDSGATYSALYLGDESLPSSSANSWVVAHKKMISDPMENGFQIAKWSGASCSGFLNILTNGNVGIGTTNPEAKLEVSGVVKSYNTPKAWVSFNGNSPVAINNSYGIAASNGVQRISAGYYKITWATPFPNANYIVVGACNALGLGGTMFTIEGNNNPSSSYYGFKPASVDVGCRISSSNTNADGDLIMVTAY